MANNRPDFVQVQLSDAGVKAANGGKLTVARGKQPYTFTAATPVEVERSFEWNVWLSQMHTPAGQPLFELAPVPATPPISKAASLPAASAVPPTAAASEPATDTLPTSSQEKS